MVFKKKCACGWVASAITAKAAIQAIKEHCEHAQHEMVDVKNV